MNGVLQIIHGDALMGNEDTNLSTATVEFPRPAPDRQSRRATRERTEQLPFVVRALELGWQRNYDGRAWSYFSYERADADPEFAVHWNESGPIYDYYDYIGDKYTTDADEALSWLEIAADKSRLTTFQLTALAPRLLLAARRALPHLQTELSIHKRRPGLGCKFVCLCGLQQATESIAEIVSLVDRAVRVRAANQITR